MAQDTALLRYLLKGARRATAPIMGGAGTTTVSSITDTTALLGGTYTDGGSPITATGFVLYPSGNPSTIIGGPGVLQFPDATLPSPISANATGLLSGTNYCFKPYATNSVGTSYGVELCFMTLASFLYFANYSSNHIRRIDIPTFTLDTGYIVSGVPTAEGITSKGDFFYVNNSTGNTIQKISKSTGAIAATLNLGTLLQDIVIVGNYLYATGRGDGSLRKIDLTTFVQVSSLSGRSAGATHDIVSDGTYLYVSSTNPDNNVKKIDISTFTVVGTYTTGLSGLQGLYLDGVGGGVVVATTSGSAQRFSTSTMTAIGSSLAITGNPQKVFYYGGNYYVTCYTGNTLQRIDASSFALTGTLTGFSGPQFGVITGTFLYICNRTNNTVSKVDISGFSIVSSISSGGTLPVPIYFG